MGAPLGLARLFIALLLISVSAPEPAHAAMVLGRPTAGAAIRVCDISLSIAQGDVIASRDALNDAQTGTCSGTLTATPQFIGGYYVEQADTGSNDNHNSNGLARPHNAGVDVSAAMWGSVGGSYTFSYRSDAMPNLSTTTSDTFLVIVYDTSLAPSGYLYYHVTVAPRRTPQTITFANPGPKSLSNSPVTLNATASSGLPVAFTSLTTSVCTVSGNSVTLLQAGTCTIKADQAGDATYAAASSVSQSFTVTLSAIAITPTTLPSGTVYAGYSQTLSATGGTAPYTYAVTAGALPDGLALSSTGTLSGTPTTQGSASFTVTATDGSSPAQTGSQAYTLMIAAPASGYTRTWVSGTGDDSAICSRSAPCATFAAAFLLTAPGGEIDCVDEGGYGGLTITHAVSIVCSDKVGRAGVLVSNGDGITIAAGASDAVVLSGLDFEGVGNSTASPGINGVRFVSGGTLVIEHSVFRGWRGYAVDFEPGASAQVTLEDVRITDSGSASTADSGGVLVRPQAGTARATIAGVQVANGQQYGIRLETASGTQVYATITGSVVSGNANTGVLSRVPGGMVQTAIVGSTITGNARYGVITNGAGITTLSGSTISRNGTGLLAQNGGVTASTGDNALARNTTDGAFTRYTPEQ